jgi:hypothetical protein
MGAGQEDLRQHLVHVCRDLGLEALDVGRATDHPNDAMTQIVLADRGTVGVTRKHFAPQSRFNAVQIDPRIGVALGRHPQHRDEEGDVLVDAAQR